MYAACVHGDREDRTAAGSGNISNELSRGEVVTTCEVDVSLSCSSRDKKPLRSLAQRLRSVDGACFSSWLLCKREESKKGGS